MNNDIKVYDKTKTNILEEYDLNLGYLQDDFIIKHHNKIEGQKEEGHYEIVAEYENGGKDVNWIIDKEYIEEVPEWDEQIFIKILVFGYFIMGCPQARCFSHFPQLILYWNFLLFLFRFCYKHA